MIVPLNRSIVMAEVIQWARLQLASTVQCPLSEVLVNVEQGDKGLEVLFNGPGIGGDSPDIDTRLIFRRMMVMAQERLEGLKTRRVK